MKKIDRNELKKITVGFFAGIISGLFTAGGGLILVPALIYRLKMEPKKARATAVFCVLPMVITTTFFYWKNDLINIKTGILCAVGGIVGGFTGAKLLNKIPEKYLKIVFTIFLVYAGINMLLKG